jgi:2-haloacid dehalogenase
MFHLVLEQLDVAPSEALFIDDFQRNIDAALALGIHAIHFTSTTVLQSELSRYLAYDTEDPPL